MPTSFFNTLQLVLLVGGLCLLWGLPAAWLCARYKFWGYRFFSVSLILPLAFPSYVLGFTYLGFFSHPGPFFSFLRSQGVDNFWEFKNLAGLSFVLSLSLFPYIFFMCKKAFETYGMRFLEVGYSLGFSERKSFFKLVLPAHKPWILTGLLFVSLDVLSDFGASSLFNYQSLSVLVYHIWYNFFSWQASAQIAFFLVLIALGVLFFYEKNLKKSQFTTSPQDSLSSRKELKGFKSFIAVLFLSFLWLISFFLPVLQLLVWSQEASFSEEHVSSFFQSFVLAFLGSLLVLFLSFVFNFLSRWFLKKENFVLKKMMKFILIGYGIPGTVWGVLILKFSDRWGLMFSIFPLILGYTLRFLMTGVKPLNEAMKRVNTSWDEGALISGLSPWKVFSKFQIPLLSSSCKVAFVFCFIEILKEMPMTLMMRPFHWTPLSVKIFELTSEGEWERAAPFSLWIVLLASLVLLLFKKA